MRRDVVLLVLLVLPALAPLGQKGYFTMHDDLQSMRQYQLDICLADGQIPCRWVPDMGYGYGYPLFNFYPPLPYLIGQVYRWAGLAYIDVVKAVGVTGFVVTAIGMYLLGRQFWGRRGGLISAAFYTYAPYHSVDFYVRGAMNEFWAMALYPFIFWATYRLISTQQKKWIPVVSLGVAGLMLAHNPMLMIFAPLLVAWCLFWIIKLHRLATPEALKALLNLGLSALWAGLLSAFFTLPVVFESQYVSIWTLTAGYFNYLAHFLDLNQMFWRINWGYGESVYGPGDTMSFAIGYLHWLVPALVLLLVPFVKKLRRHASLILLLAFFVVVSLFMSHFKATPIWQAIKPLEFLQFPWRFLTLVVFVASFLAGGAGLVLSRQVVSLLLLLLLLLNANYFRPRLWLPDMTDAQKFSGNSWRLLVTSGIFDYLPLWAPLPPADAAGDDIGILSGQATFTRLEKRSNRQVYSIDVASPATIVQLQTYYFPGWKIFVDGQEVRVDPTRDKLLGRMEVDLGSGKHTVEAKFGDTPVRRAGNALSVVGWLALLGVGSYSVGRIARAGRRPSSSPALVSGGQSS